MSDSFHMTPDEFRRHGHSLVDRIARYMARIAAPVQSSVKPGDVRALLPSAAPEEPEPFEALVRDLETVVLPGITQWQSPPAGLPTSRPTPRLPRSRALSRC